MSKKKEKKEPQMCVKDRLLTTLRANETVLHVLPLYERVAEWRAPEPPPIVPPPLGWSDIRQPVRGVAGNVSAASDMMTIIELHKELGWDGRIIQRTVNGKDYIIFKGHPGQRRIFRGTRYRATHPTVVRMAIGPKGLRRAFVRGSALSVVMYTSLDVLEYLFSDTVGLHALLGQVTADLIGVGISALVGALAGLAVGFTGIATMPAAPLIAAIGVGFVTGLVLNELDERFGATKALIDFYERMGVDLMETWDDVKALPATVANEVDRWERGIVHHILRHRSIGY